MNTLRALVVDDEKPARTRLLELLDKQSGVEILPPATDGQEAVTAIRAHRPDLLFLDIQMPGLDGFGVLRELGPQPIPVTVFVTAYDKYAIQAFEAHALDYLLKPFSDERFQASLERARKQIRTQAASEIGLKLAGLLAEKATAQPVDRLVLKSNGRVTLLDTAEIDWIEAAGVYVYLHAGAKSHLYRATLGQLEQRLDPRRFVRVHRSAMVNTDRIQELQPRSHGDYVILLKTAAEVSMSRGYRANLEGWLRQPL